MSRIESITTGWRPSAANGRINYYLDQTTFGELVKVHINSGNWANGSVFIRTSGTSPVETYLSKTNASGTGTTVIYPRVRINNTVGGSLSGTSLYSYDKPILMDKLHFTASGLGNGKSGLLTIYYKTP